MGLIFGGWLVASAKELIYSGQPFFHSLDIHAHSTNFGLEATSIVRERHGPDEQGGYDLPNGVQNDHTKRIKQIRMITVGH